MQDDAPYDQPLPIEEYGLIGDCATCALVGSNGSIDWLCWPRFDSAACFAALLGDSRNGRWKIATDGPSTTSRRYRDQSMVLETLFETESGAVKVIDFMVPNAPHSSIVRIVEGVRGRVAMATEITIRFDYGLSVPWVTQLADGSGLCAIAGPELAVLRTTVDLVGESMQTVGRFSVSEGERATFVMSHGPSHETAPGPVDALAALAETEKTWADWCARCTYQGEWRDAVLRSLMVLKALTYNLTGGIVAAATTSLPEQLGGVRNWDYRYCWLRDATLTLFSFMHCGYFDEAAAWRDWLHRSIAGSPDQIRIMYGIAGERRLDEWEVPWLAGYQGAKPVRVGNAASDQLQLDVFGEVMGALHIARKGGLKGAEASWQLQMGIIKHLEGIWREPDDGIWETRGGRKQFTFSKVMAWLAFDAMIKDVEAHGLEGPVDHWREVRAEIHAQVCAQGFNAQLGSFTQSYGSDDLDASLLLIPLVGFLPHGDPRVAGTVDAIEKTLLQDDFVMRYNTDAGSDGLPPGEGAFLACSFWLVDCLHMGGRPEEARAIFERLMGLRNSLGLLSEEYDPRTKRLVGNMPQAFSHTAMIATIMNIADGGPAHVRAAE